MARSSHGLEVSDLTPQGGAECAGRQGPAARAHIPWAPSQTQTSGQVTYFSGPQFLHLQNRPSASTRVWPAVRTKWVNARAVLSTEWVLRKGKLLQCRCYDHSVRHLGCGRKRAVTLIPGPRSPGLCPAPPRGSDCTSNESPALPELCPGAHHGAGAVRAAPVVRSQ